MNSGKAINLRLHRMLEAEARLELGFPIRLRALTALTQASSNMTFCTSVSLETTPQC